MREQLTHAWNRRTAIALTRRASLLALSGMGLITAAGFSSASAGKTSKKAKKRCKRQVGQCERALAPACTDPDLAVSEEECLALLLPCCQQFADCQAGAAFACLIAASEAMAPPPP